MSDDIHREIDKLEDYIDLKTIDLLLPNDHLICECNCVSVQDIRDCFAKEKKVDLETLAEKFLLGTGCQSCLKNVSEWKEKIF